MDDAVVVGVRERRRHRGDGRDHLARTQPTTPRQEDGQAAAGEQLQHQRHPRGPASLRLVHHLEQAHEVRVVETAEQGRLAGLAVRVAGDQDLDGHWRAAAPRNRPPDLAGAATPQPRLQDVPGYQRHGVARNRRRRTCRKP